MPAPRFRDDQWNRIYQILRDDPGLYIRQEAATRRFVENVLWIARAGCAWRLLPEEYGAWSGKPIGGSTKSATKSRSCSAFSSTIPVSPRASTSSPNDISPPYTSLPHASSCGKMSTKPRGHQAVSPIMEFGHRISKTIAAERTEDGESGQCSGWLASRGITGR